MRMFGWTHGGVQLRGAQRPRCGRRRARASRPGSIRNTWRWRPRAWRDEGRRSRADRRRPRERRHRVQDDASDEWMRSRRRGCWPAASERRRRRTRSPSPSLRSRSTPNPDRESRIPEPESTPDFDARARRAAEDRAVDGIWSRRPSAWTLERGAARDAGRRGSAPRSTPNPRTAKRSTRALVRAGPRASRWRSHPRRLRFASRWPPSPRRLRASRHEPQPSSRVSAS